MISLENVSTASAYKHIIPLEYSICPVCNFYRIKHPSLVLLLLFLSPEFIIIFLQFFKCFKVGDRCEVDPGAKRGVIKYVGQAESIAPGFWVGVQYDEPLGKHDGM